MKRATHDFHRSSQTHVVVSSRLALLLLVSLGLTGSCRKSDPTSGNNQAAAGQKSSAKSAQPWRPPASEIVTDVHYGMVVYLGGLDPLMQLGPRSRLTLAQLRGETRRIRIVPTFNAFEAGRFSRKSLNRAKLEKQLHDFGTRLREAMSPAERRRFESLIPSELYGVKIVEKDGVGFVQYRARFVVEPTAKLEAPRERFEDLVKLDDLDEIFELTDHRVVKPVLKVLREGNLVGSRRQAVCQALLKLKEWDGMAGNQDVHQAFCRWAGPAQMEMFPRMLAAGHPHKWYKRETMRHFLELDADRAVTYVAREAPEKQIQFLLDFLAAEHPEVGRKACLQVLGHRNPEMRKKALDALGVCGKPGDKSAMQQSVDTTPEAQRNSVGFAARGAFEAIDRRSRGSVDPSHGDVEKGAEQER